jgi:hypothetical protein
MKFWQQVKTTLTLTGLYLGSHFYLSVIKKEDALKRDQLAHVPLL